MHNAKPKLGVCAMDTKARSKSMQNILSNLLMYQEFEVILFGDQAILEEPIEQWPKCDVLIAFFSHGFPLAKAIEYVKLVQPYCVNDLLMQELLLDRRVILSVLDSIDVPSSRRLFRNLDRPQLSHEVLEIASRNFGLDLYSPQFRINDISQDYLECILPRPFVEKPADAENHDINIYYPDGTGRRLFRKIENKSSEFDSNLNVIRADGKSYVYEEFLMMDNAEDIKVYTVGPYHTYAETRKSPSVNGIVKRNPDGKEIRKITELTKDEKEIARRICMAFGQTICGFDMLRVNGKSYVIDVNGWSFVKGSPEYDALCANVLRSTFIRVTRDINMTRELAPSEKGGEWKLKCFIEVLRHADRTPKLKFKMKTSPQMFLCLDDIEDQEEKVNKAYEIALNNKESNQQQLNTLIEILKNKRHLSSLKIQRRLTKDGNSLLIVKWGGEFTHAGRHQAQELGETTRKDLAILNKETLDNVRIQCSVERRVQATADVFAKGLLKMAEIPYGLITSNKDILDHASIAKTSLENVKSNLIQEISELDDESEIKKVLSLFQTELNEIRKLMNFNYNQVSKKYYDWCCSETPMLFKERWEKHFRDLLEVDIIDPARISDLYDSIKYDILHHRGYIEQLLHGGERSSESLIRDVFSKTQLLFAFLSPKENGLFKSEKLEIGLKISGPLLLSIINELESSIESKSSPKARFYFTKESHMVALMNVLVNCNLPLARRRTGSVLFPEHLTEDPSWFGEMDYLSQICFELHEKKRPDNSMKYSLRIGMSQGAHDPHLLDLHLDRRHYLAVSPKKWIINSMNAEEIARKRKWDLDDKGKEQPSPEDNAAPDAEDHKAEAVTETKAKLTLSDIAARINASLASKDVHIESKDIPNIIKPTEKSETESAAATTAEPSILEILGVSKDDEGKKLKEDQKTFDLKSAKFIDRVDINDTRHRYYLCKQATLEEIGIEFDVSIISRGKYYPNRSMATEKDPPLLLEIRAKSQDALDKVLAHIKELIEKGPANGSSSLPAASAPLSTPTFIVERVYFGVEPTESVPAFTIRGKILGPQGSFLKHIQTQTGCKVHLRGKGSGYMELGNTEEANDRLHLFISGMKKEDVEQAKELAEDLLQHIRKEVEQLIANSMRPPTVNAPYGMMPYGAAPSGPYPYPYYYPPPSAAPGPYPPASVAYPSPPGHPYGPPMGAPYSVAPGYPYPPQPPAGGYPPYPYQPAQEEDPLAKGIPEETPSYNSVPPPPSYK